MQDYEFPQIGKITVSQGFSGAHMRSPSPTELLSQADEALYYAKENGRNRVCHYETLQALGKSCKTLRNVWYMSACNGILTGHEAKQP